MYTRSSHRRGSLAGVLTFSVLLVGASSTATLAQDDAYMGSMGGIDTASYVPTLDKGDLSPKICFANYTRAVDFTVTVEEGVQRAAQDAGIEIVIQDNNADPIKAVQNTRTFINEGCDGVIMYQGDAPTNDVIGELLRDASIPVVAFDIPVPGGAFFGGNNSEAGRLAGAALGEIYLAEGFPAESSAMLLVESTTNGLINELRMQGYIDGFLEQVPDFPEDQIFRLDTDNLREDAVAKTTQWLSGHPEFEHVLVGALHDGVALGAYQALQVAGRDASSRIVSQGCDAGAVEAIGADGGTYVGSVAYFPQDYGFNGISMLLDVLNGRPIPNEYFVAHDICTIDSLDELTAP